MKYLQRNTFDSSRNTTLHQFTSWRQSQNSITKIWFVIFFAGLTGLFSQIKIYLPWTPVPITLQTVAVITSGIILGKHLGLYSQVLYILLGVIGIPWFANQQGGIAIILGPTVGYLIGFCISSYLAGWFTEKFSTKMEKSLLIFAILLTINFTAIYIPGLIHLSSWFSIMYSTKLSLYQLIFMGLIPFIIGDIIKIALITIVHSNSTKAL